MLCKVTHTQIRPDVPLVQILYVIKAPETQNAIALYHAMGPVTHQVHTKTIKVDHRHHGMVFALVEIIVIKLKQMRKLCAATFIK